MPRLRRDARGVIYAVTLPQRYNIELLQQEEGRGNSQSFDLISEPRLNIIKEQAIQPALIWLIAHQTILCGISDTSIAFDPNDSIRLVSCFALFGMLRHFGIPLTCIALITESYKARLSVDGCKVERRFAHHTPYAVMSWEV